MTDKVKKSEAEWQAELSPAQYQIMRGKGTEPPFTGQYWDTHTPGTYVCAGCGAPLFDADTKFDSGTGWPSFFKPRRQEQRRHRDRRQPFHGANRGAVRPMRRPSGPCLSRWAGAHRAALLHEFGVAEAGAEEIAHTREPRDCSARAERPAQRRDGSS